MGDEKGLGRSAGYPIPTLDKWRGWSYGTGVVMGKIQTLTLKKVKRQWY